LPPRNDLLDVDINAGLVSGVNETEVEELKLSVCKGADAGGVDLASNGVDGDSASNGTVANSSSNITIVELAPNSVALDSASNRVVADSDSNGIVDEFDSDNVSLVLLSN